MCSTPEEVIRETGSSPGLGSRLVAKTRINCRFVLAIGNSLGYSGDILIGVTSMSRIFTTLTVTQQSSPAGVAFGMPTVDVADAARNESVLAARGAG
jgi:hypothetical protein